MKRRNYNFSMLLCFLCVGFIVTTAQATAIRLEASTANILVGDTFDLNVYADEVPLDGVFSFGFDVEFDDSMFDYNTALINPAFFMDHSQLFPDTDVAGAVLFPPTFPSGDNILLASLSFTALQTGDFSLGILSDWLDPTEGLRTSISPLPTDMTSSIDVSVAPVPEPATMLLFATGLVGLVGLRRKTKK